MQVQILTQQIKYEQDRNKQLEEELDTLDAQLAEGNDGSSKGSKITDGIKQLIDTVTPVVDKHFELREKELNQRERYLQGNGRSNGSVKRMNRAAPATREDGGVETTDPGYEEYFLNVWDQGTEQDFDYECDYLEKTNPELYAQLNEKHGIDAPEEEGKEEQHGE